jgi:hypothetical protein
MSGAREAVKKGLDLGAAANLVPLQSPCES